MKVSKFQKLIRDLYFERDQNRGINSTFIWLIEEIGELARVLRGKELDLESAAEELADIIAWTTSVANLLDIDLEHALFKKYPNTCPKCKQIPCSCD
jgi:NTP pyrophosphatase (non-canonical NTP hydrolase)